MDRATFRIIVLALGIVLCADASCVAQSRDSVAVGARVRVILRDSMRQSVFAPRTQALIGTLVARQLDTLTLTIGAADTARVSRPQIRGIAVSRGTSRFRSAVVQAAFGALVGNLFSDRELPRWANVSVSAGLGGVVGMLAPYEHWRRVRW